MLSFTQVAFASALFILKVSAWISLNLHTTQVLPFNRDYFLAEIVTETDSPPCYINYLSKPASWIQSNQYLYIPYQYSQRSNGAEYPIEFKITNMAQEQATFNGSIKVTNNGFSFQPNAEQGARENQASILNSQDPQNASAAKLPAQQKINSQKIAIPTVIKEKEPQILPIKSIISVPSNIRKVIPEEPPKQQNLSPSPINSIMDKKAEQSRVELMNEKRLASMINSNDILGLSQTVQQISVLSGVDCELKILSLVSIFGKIYQKVEQLSAYLSKISAQRTLSKSRIEQLRSELSSAQKTAKDSKLENLYSDLQLKLHQLQAKYQKHNAIAASEQRMAVEFAQLKKQSLQLESQLETDRKHLQNYRDELSHAQSEDILAIHQSLIKKQMSLIKKKQDYLDALNSKLKQTEKTIGIHEKVLDVLKVDYLQMEIEVDRVKNEIEAAKVEQDGITRNILLIKNSILNEENKNVDADINKVSSQLNLLKKQLSNIQQKVDQIFENCYDLREMPKLDGKPSKIVYSMNNQEFQLYFRSFYGMSEKIIKENSATEYTNEVIEKPLVIIPTVIDDAADVIGATGVIGATTSPTPTPPTTTPTPPPPPESQPKTQNKPVTNLICFMKFSPSLQGSGVIKFISKDLIIALTKQNELFYLKLSTCSKVLSNSSPIPNIGQTIYWKGVVNP